MIIVKGEKDIRFDANCGNDGETETANYCGGSITH